MAWLVIAPEADEAARWAAAGLVGLGLEPLQVVVDVDLVGARWTHRIDDDGVTTLLELVDGRTIDSAELRGTLNRLSFLSPAIVEPLVSDDRLYGLQEMSALVMSWLASLPGAVVNPPDPRGLGGAWRSPAEWASLAAEAGVPCAPVYVDSDADHVTRDGGWLPAGPHAPLLEDVIVVGDAVFCRDDLDPEEVAAFRRLARLSGCPLLGVAFADGTHAVDGVTPLPDLRAGGDETVAALADTLGARRAGS
ncbi:hypothetical protein [Desertimonas flava]|uniref:hypothetical protein n=1 Tax=Desertimonas flava TaxID=2064846 RepID=UPI000E3522E2|nr:hypothetical protein [Desertimonas flava]